MLRENENLKWVNPINPYKTEILNVTYELPKTKARWLEIKNHVPFFTSKRMGREVEIVILSVAKRNEESRFEVKKHQMLHYCSA